MVSLFDTLFRCSHKKTTFPMTRTRGNKSLETDKRTYIVCVDCGKEILYNWQEMRVADPGEAKIPARAVARQELTKTTSDVVSSLVQ